MFELEIWIRKKVGLMKGTTTGMRDWKWFGKNWKTFCEKLSCAIVLFA